MERKYEFTGETIQFDNRTLHRIRALRDIPKIGVEKWNLGGWIECENNLSQKGDCWVKDDAKVSGLACVTGNALIAGRARVAEGAKISGEVEISDDAIVFGKADLSEHVVVCGHARIHGNAQIKGVDVRIYGRSEIYGEVLISDNRYPYQKHGIKIHGDAMIFELAWIDGWDIEIFDKAKISGCSHINNETKIFGNAKISGIPFIIRSKIYGNTQIIIGGTYDGVEINEDAKVYKDLRFRD